MKKSEQEKAVVLRKEGRSIKEIARLLQVSTGSVSYWVRDIALTAAQRKGLTERGFSKDAVEKRRYSRIQRTLTEHAQITDAAAKSIATLSRYELMLVGTALYWGEGGKTKKSGVRLASSDPKIIRIMMRFFREICAVEESRFRGHVHTFAPHNARESEKYWASVSGIPISKFFKTYAKPSSAGAGLRKTLPYGTFQIYVCDTKLFLKLMGWIDGIAIQGS